MSEEELNGSADRVLLPVCQVRLDHFLRNPEDKRTVELSIESPGMLTVSRHYKWLLCGGHHVLLVWREKWI